MTQDSVEFKRLNGKELVYFESSISKGLFLHNATLKELSFVIGVVAVFLTKGFEGTRGHTLKQVRYNCKRYFQTRFYELVGLREDHIRAIK